MTSFVFNNKIMDKIVYKTKNIIIQKIQEGKKRQKCYIIGNGNSLSVDTNNVVTKHDSCMKNFYPKINNDNTVYTVYLTVECLGLNESSKEIAQFVNNLSEGYDRIFLVGHSKCGLCFYNASNYCEKNILLVTISTPFSGTILANKKAVEKKLKFKIFKKIYNIIFNNHFVNQDIMPNSHFIQNMPTVTYKQHINITSSFKNLFSCKNIIDLFLFIMDKFMQINGDGFVPLTSQSSNDAWTINLICSHAKSLKKGLEIIEKL